MDPIKLLGMVLGPDALAVFSEIKTALPKWLEEFEQMKQQLNRIESDIAALRKRDENTPPLWIRGPGFDENSEDKKS